MADLATEVVALLEPRPGERILDLGCGDGALTQRLAAAGCDVVGVDASGDQVAAARRRGLDARVGDGERLGFECEFDAVFSNSALHWMLRADNVIAGVRRALRAGDSSPSWPGAIASPRSCQRSTPRSPGAASMQRR